MDSPIWKEELASVAATGPTTSHWVLNPGDASHTVEWDAGVLADEPGKRIAWRSIGGDIDQAGEIIFEPAPRAIVNIASIGGKVGVPHLLPYVAAKFALTAFSEALHAEFRNRGVRVTTVCPGLMRTGGEVHAQFRVQVRKEKAWLRLAARTPLIAVSVTHAANKIFHAVDQGHAEITITPQAWLVARFVGPAPETTQQIAAMIHEQLLPSPAKSAGLQTL